MILSAWAAHRLSGTPVRAGNAIKDHLELGSHGTVARGGTLCKGGVGVQADSLLTNDLRDNVIAMVWALCVIWVPWYRGYIQDATCERMLWYGSRCSGEMVPAGPTQALAP